jgi:hypothetical protein
MMSGARQVSESSRQTRASAHADVEAEGDLWRCARALAQDRPPGQVLRQRVTTQVDAD